MRTSIRYLAGFFLSLASGLTAAHHSFAVHYDGERIVSVTGVVEAFRFRNPHGIIVVAGASDEGLDATWTIETNSPNILKRRGWTEDSIRAGDEVVIEGFPANDGSPAMRVYRVRFADGRELVGQRPAAGIER
jgi:hypothetical protein